jgi:hypothetical protein
LNSSRGSALVHSSAQGIRERSRLQAGIDQLEAVYQEQADFAHGRAAHPAWASWLSTFRAALDAIKHDAAEYDLILGGPV